MTAPKSSPGPGCRQRPGPGRPADYGDERLPARFWQHVHPEPNTGCWLWYGSEVNGYGQFTDGTPKRKVKAHRTAYAALVAPIPPGLVIDHLCRQRACVNPAHLEATTNRANILRGVGVTAQMARKTHCKHGHEYAPDNIVWRYESGRSVRVRRCLRCYQDYLEARREQRRTRRDRSAPVSTPGSARAGDQNPTNQ